MKQKFSTASSILESTRQENDDMKKRVDQLREELTNAQMALAKGKSGAGGSAGEAAELQQRLTQSSKQIEDLKRQNKMLNEKVMAAQSKKSSGDGMSEAEMKRKLESSTRLLGQSKKEAELAQTRLLEMQKEDIRMKGEIVKLQNELKAAKAASKSGGKKAA